MATTTPNFGWDVPTSTDLVTNGAVAIETLGDQIDADVWNLENNSVKAAGNFRTGSRTLSVTENVEGTYIAQTFSSTNRNDGTPFFINRSTGTTSATVVQFYRNGTAAGTINASTTAAPTLVAPSDYRLKENVEPLTDAANRIKSANVYTYNMIADEDKELRYGFLAHEVQDLMHDLVIGEKDAVDENGEPVYQQIQETRLIPVLVAALKDALVKIDDLETRLAKLEPTPTATRTTK
jgi:hypothetical protein